MNTVPPHHSPVILLLGKQATGCDPFDRWLAGSRYRAWAADDVFQLLDQLSDFTIRNRPDIIFIHVGATVEEHDFIRNLIEAGTSEEGLRVIDLVTESSQRTALDLDVTISTLENQLDLFIPHDNAATS